LRKITIALAILATGCTPYGRNYEACLLNNSSPTDQPLERCRSHFSKATYLKIKEESFAVPVSSKGVPFVRYGIRNKTIDNDNDFYVSEIVVKATIYRDGGVLEHYTWTIPIVIPPKQKATFKIDYSVIEKTHPMAGWDEAYYVSKYMKS
jgi:hypothetical protein